VCVSVRLRRCVLCFFLSFFPFFFSPKRHFFFSSKKNSSGQTIDWTFLCSFLSCVYTHNSFADDALVKISAFAANPPPPLPPSPFTKAKMTTTKTNDEKSFIEEDESDIKNTRINGKKNVLKKETINRLIKDVSRVDFAAPAPAYLENNLGQSNVRRYLSEPGPKDGSHSRCRIVRKKDAFGYCTYVLYADCPPNPPPPPPSSSMREGKDLFDENRNEEKNGRRCKSRFEARALCAARKRKKSRR
jgi:hypothetical protein